MRNLGAGLFLIWLAAHALPAQAEVDYQRDVRPILKQHCYTCHGALRQKGGLRLDHVAFVRQGGESGPAIGSNADDSLLLRAVTGSGDIERMPLEAKPLPDEQIATLKAWIVAGAPAPEEKLPADPRRHWAFVRPARPPLPTVQNPEWMSHPIDRFLAAEHERRGLEPTTQADKHVLLRRVYLDLIGLPPSPAELREFAADQADDAYERVVDKLLASPQYGERWARHWMDVWRYSDWDGFGNEVRESQPNIWRWRDWIIESLNADKPYDEMIREMLAADELAPDDPAALRANGFLVRNWYRFNRNVWLEAAVEHTSKAFLGVTLNCARCHDHMYDPILQTDYYQFRAFFEPHDIRTDSMLAETSVGKNELVRVYDADAAKPTYLFARGNEAKPDQAHPLSPGVPAVLGGEELKIDPVAFATTTYYPGFKTSVREETFAKAQADVTRSEEVIAKANAALAEARKKRDEFIAAKPKATSEPATADKAAADKAATESTPVEKAATEASEAALVKAVSEAESAAALAAQELLSAAAHLVTVRAKLAADQAAFSAPPATNAQELAREANRAERISNLEQAKRNAMRLERDLAEAQAGTDDAAKKKAEATQTKLAAARTARDAAQTALGQAADSYAHFGQVYPATSTGRRAALARWISSKSNPLTARVAINHIWMRHFGTPLVPTVFDFGLNGKPPTHPALLDWLACELMDQGWRTKSIHRLQVTSRAYRLQSASDHIRNRERDPENAYLWRMNPRRMEAEVVRDSTLRVADGLDLTMYGPDLDQDSGLTVLRRSIYFRSSKEKKVTFLEMFDSPNVTDCYRRSETVVPQQALAMVNSSLTLAQARRLAESLARPLSALEDAQRPAAFVAAAFERILCRAPTGEEGKACLEFLDTQARRLADTTALVAFTTGGENAVKPSGDPAQRARENLIHVLLNHNDFLTVR